MTEEWLPIPGFVGAYEVSDLGRIRGLDRMVGSRSPNGRRHKGCTLRLSVGGNRYLTVQLKFDEKRLTRGVHQLVLAAFVGPCPPGMEVLHCNGDKLDNRLANLRYGTRRENNIDSIVHGTHPWASKTHCPQGHPYSGDNLKYGVRGDGRKFRQCRSCRKVQRRSLKLKK